MADQRIVNELYNGYEKYISMSFLDAYGEPGMQYDTIGDKWRQQIPYNPDAEKLLIAKSVLFMRTLNRSNKYSRDVYVLQDMGLRMAKFLSVYKMRENALPDTPKERDVARKVARDALRKLLVEGNPYICEMQNYKPAQKVGKYKPNSRKSWSRPKPDNNAAATAVIDRPATKTHRKHKPLTPEQKAKIADAAIIRRQVQAMFDHNEWNFTKYQ